MKKNLLKLGALAVALVVLFAACAQPVEETKSKEEDVIIRLFLDRPANETLDVGDRLQIRAGTKFAIPGYLDLEEEKEYVIEVPAGGVTDNSNVFWSQDVYKIKRSFWKPRTRGDNINEATGADIKHLIPLARSRTIPWSINPAALSTDAAVAVTNAPTSSSAIMANAVPPSVSAILANDQEASSFVYVSYHGTPPTDHYYGAADLSWIDDPAVQLATKMDAYGHFKDNVNTQYISAAMSSDPAWALNGPITSTSNPWYSVLDSYLPQKGTPTNPNNKYYETGTVVITDGVADNNHNTIPPTMSNLGGVPKIVSKNAYYIDLVLINKTVDDPLKGGSLKKSVSVYLELEVLPPNGTPVGTNNTMGGMDNRVFYMYTKGKHGFNNWDYTNGKWMENNDNIKPLSLKPGINEVYLRYFSSTNASDEMHL
jgi:hypothetical protein